MKNIIVIALMILINSIISAQNDVLTDQKRYNRVRTAIKEKEKSIIKELNKIDIRLDELNIIIIAYKEESELEIFVKKDIDTIYKKLKTYNICSKSGILGPKRKQGDYQVPEGFYFIDRFNPASMFYLSLGINYPNLSDRRKSNAANLGGDIFIHGSCVTIGCLPMTDNNIKEIYLYAINARNNGQNRVPVYIFPFQMTDDNYEIYKEQYRDNSELIEFWENIKTGYNYFEKEREELNVSVSNNGDYIIE